MSACEGDQCDFSCIRTNLSNGGMSVHEEGPSAMDAERDHLQQRHHQHAIVHPAHDSLTHVHTGSQRHKD